MYINIINFKTKNIPVAATAAAAPNIAEAGGAISKPLILLLKAKMLIGLQNPA